MTIEQVHALQRKITSLGVTYAQAWDYCVSHSVLRIRLGDTLCGLSLHDCTRVSFDQVWQLQAFTMDLVPTRRQPRLRVHDGPHFDVECEGVLFLEGMKLF
jgi:hypothetical protein